MPPPGVHVAPRGGEKQGPREMSLCGEGALHPAQEAGAVLCLAICLLLPRACRPGAAAGTAFYSPMPRCEGTAPAPVAA